VAIINFPLWKTVVASAILYVLCVASHPAIQMAQPLHFGLTQYSAAVTNTASGVRVQGPGTPPQLGFACCDHGIEQMQSLFANKEVIEDLRDLHAEVAIPTLDFSSERAATVRLLNQADIPVIAWIMLSKEEGFYLNADNAPQAVERITQFEGWSSNNNLKWAKVGLDIEPNFNELAVLRTHRWRLITALGGRLLDGARITRARQSYLEITHQIQLRGYPVQIYQMPYIPAERGVHSTLLDRLLGTLDVHGDQEYLMLYTSFARQVGAGMIWSMGRNAQAISIGSTDSDSAAGIAAGPLDWDEFARDLIVASHFSKNIGVYDLEGCVRQGFLLRLKDMDWSRSVTIPATSISRAKRLGLVLRTLLWIGSNLPYLILAVFLFLLFWRVRRKRIRQQVMQTLT
jgi:hypothetical protein